MAHVSTVSSMGIPGTVPMDRESLGVEMVTEAEMDLVVEVSRKDSLGRRRDN